MSVDTLDSRNQVSGKREAALNQRITMGLGLVGLLALAIAGWAANSQISGAIIASGKVVVETSDKKIQHPTGGVVGEILVKSGDRVKAGDVLMRLDDTQTSANLGIVTSQLVELTGRNARLAAQRDGAASITFPPNFEQSSGDAKRVANGERRLFAFQQKASEGRRAQLRSRVIQYRHEIDGLSKQERAKAKELKLVNEEFDKLEKLYASKLVPQTRVLAMERDAARIEGEHGSLISQIARTEGSISETELKILEIDETVVADAQKDYRETEARIAELQERLVAAQDTLKRVEMRAPQSGTIHELAVHTIGGVIGPGDTVMSLVPDSDQNAIEVRLQPTDIDQVTIGQNAVLRFPAFHQQSTPELKGNVSRLAAEISTDQQTGMSYYTARISVAADELAKLGDKQLVPGMPVDGFIQTGDRTALSFLSKPFTDQVARAFREE